MAHKLKLYFQSCCAEWPFKSTFIYKNEIKVLLNSFFFLFKSMHKKSTSCYPFPHQSKSNQFNNNENKRNVSSLEIRQSTEYRVQTTFLSDFSLITPYIVKQKCKGIMVKKKVILTCIYSTCTTAAN